MKSLYLLPLCILLLTACADKPSANTPVTEPGATLTIPRRLELYQPTPGAQPADSSAFHTKLKIYTLIDVSCSTCILRLEKWSQMQAELKDNKEVAVIPICHAKDNFELLKYLCENNKVGSVQIPLVLDIDNTFRKENALLIDQHGETTVLTDAHNRILLTGNPIESKEDKEKFFQKIHDSQ